MFAAQKEFLDALEQINEHWFARAKSEAEFANAMADKLAAARSMPDMTIVYQDWFGQRVQRYVEDSNHILADVQKLIADRNPPRSKRQGPRRPLYSAGTGDCCAVARASARWRRCDRSFSRSPLRHRT